MDTNYEKKSLLYEGKAKKVYSVCVRGKSEIEYCIMEFKDDLTAFDGEKYAQREGKGTLNCQITAKLFDYLEHEGITTHYKELLSERDMLVQMTEIIPIEVVVRNVVSGSLVKRLGLSKGEYLANPIVEFYYKKDELHDPMINEDHIFTLNLADKLELNKVSSIALTVNNLLQRYFKSIDLILVDFKLEFGRNENGELILADEITPDTCRLWDVNTGASLDKDVFRQSSGDVLKGYQEIYQRMSGEGK